MYAFGRCQDVGLTAGLVNPRTGRTPCILHLAAGLDMNPLCARLGLPRGQRDTVWQATAWQATLAVLGLLLVVTLVWWLRRPRCSVDTPPHFHVYAKYDMGNQR